MQTFQTSGTLASMALSANGKPPSEKRIGSRIRVRPENADEAAKLFEQNGFQPIYVDYRADGDISFWFGKAPDNEKFRLLSSIPREFYAIQGVVVGDQHPFLPKRANGS
ncbi:MAG TPA: hypothetical protein VNJ10_01950 [Sphingomonas sp.]|nr:hypothetical protein [Sphingomonas sp.]